MLDRRECLQLLGLSAAALLTSACARQTEEATSVEANETAADGGAIVILYDTYAQALYFDGTYGPFTGDIEAVDMAAGTDKTYDFWHGHEGVLHRFTLTAQHFADLRAKKRVNLLTTVVDDHQHQLFVDPVDPQWRVPGGGSVQI
jgi:hypothetical protein